MTRVIHTGDTHIGYRQYHSPDRRQDFLDAFESVVDDAIGDESSTPVDAVVHAGDLFHDRRPDLPDLLGTLSALRRLADAGVPFLAIVGNHEATRGSQWLDLFSDLGLAVRLDDEPTTVGDTAFYGLDHVPRSRREELTYDFAPHDAEHAALVGHGLFTPFPHGDWEIETVLAESSVDFDAVLLGDNHTPDTVDVEGTWVTYCGSTERASTDERTARGYNLVEFGPEGSDAVDVRRRSLETRPFVYVDVTLAEGEGVDRVREQVRQHDLTDAVTVVTIEGEGDPVTPAAVEDAADEAGALLTRVTDRREVGGEGEEETDVSFADPDAAVRERLREMNLSDAGLRIDETVRDDALADSNVRDRVQSLVAETDDPGAYVRPDEDDAGDSEVRVEGGDAGDASTEADTDTDTDTDTTTMPDGPNPTGDGGTSPGPHTEESENRASDAETDDQHSMEDFL